MHKFIKGPSKGPEPRSSSAAELRLQADEAFRSDAYNPFAEDDPFHPDQNSGASRVVESILKDHASTRGAAQEQAHTLHEVPLGGGSSMGPVDTEPLPTALPLGNPFLNSTPLPDMRHLGGSWDAEAAYGAGAPEPQLEGSRGAAGPWQDAGLALPTASPKKARGLHLWGGRREASVPPALPVSLPPSFGDMLPPPDAGNGSAGVAVVASHGQAALERRQRELDRREAELARREAALARSGGIKVKNWPRFHPLVHHDIGGEVPPARQALVRTGYTAWLIICTAYLYNWLLITVMFATGQKSVGLWLFATLVAGFGVPLSFFCWYRTLYFATIRDGSMRWMWFFLHMAVNVGWDWWMFVGVRPKLGGYSAGLFTMIDQFGKGGGKGTAFGILSITNMVLWGLGGSLSFYVLGWAMRVFRQSPRAAPALAPSAEAPSRRFR